MDNDDYTRLSVTTTRDEQVAAFEEARELVQDDVDDGAIDAGTWGGDVPDGEVLRVVCEAYTGNLSTSFDDWEAGEVDETDD